MALKVRGAATYFTGVVAAARTTSGDDGRTVYEVTIRDTGGDADELILRTPWRRVLGEFPEGIAVEVELLKRPR